MKDFIIAILISERGRPFLFMGYLIWIRERIDLIHDYHHTKVKESDRKEYTAVMGKAAILIGVGIILSGVLCTGMHSGKYGVIFGISFAAGLIMMIHAQLKYNHGIF